MLTCVNIFQKSPERSICTVLDVEANLGNFYCRISGISLGKKKKKKEGGSFHKSAIHDKSAVMEPIIEYDLSSPFNPNGACDYCHKRKMRCDKTKPHCNECVKRNIQCNYGLRLKRGPKMKRLLSPVKVEEPKETDIVQEITQSSNSQIEALLFELSFHKKISELWKRLCPQEGSNPSMTGFARKIRPEFDLHTEGFIRLPNAVKSIMDDFNTTYRVMFNLSNFASNADFATLIWQAITEINVGDLLTMLNTFETPMMISVLEYLVAFTLCR